MVRTKINAKGLLPMKRCGRSRRFRALLFRLSPRVFRPLAFSMMPLSIMVMMGATNTPAEAAANASAPIRSPKLWVFHVLTSASLCGEMGVFGMAGFGRVVMAGGRAGLNSGGGLHLRSVPSEALRMVARSDAFSADGSLKGFSALLLSPIAASACG